jgi:hypothetical protein
MHDGAPEKRRGRAGDAHAVPDDRRPDDDRSDDRRPRTICSTASLSFAAESALARMDGPRRGGHFAAAQPVSPRAPASASLISRGRKLMTIAYFQPITRAELSSFWTGDF